jgi:ankyrin repeat protein
MQNNASFKFFKDVVCEQYPDEARHLLAQTDALQCLPLHHAIAAGDFTTVAFLLQKSVSLGLASTLSELINRPIANDATALHLAITSSCLPLVQFLIESGAHRNACTAVGASPLHVACVCGSDRSEAGSIEMVCV